jgi:hypothetical protein
MSRSPIEHQGFECLAVPDDAEHFVFAALVVPITAGGGGRQWGEIAHRGDFHRFSLVSKNSRLVRRKQDRVRFGAHGNTKGRP